MSKHLVDIDDDLLAEATSVLGASTMKEAVNRSLEAGCWLLAVATMPTG